MIVSPEILQLHKEIMADPKANELLKAKCLWEHMSRTAVLREWGDPRTWSDYFLPDESAARKEEE